VGIHREETEVNGNARRANAKAFPIQNERRTFEMACHTVTAAQEICYKIMVELGGGRFKGIQAGFRNRYGVWVVPLVLFDSPVSLTTLAISAPRLSARAVREHIAKSDALFQSFADKACARVFRQFGTEVAE